jgi:hypothetical protein
MEEAFVLSPHIQKGKGEWPILVRAQIRGLHRDGKSQRKIAE